MLSSYREYHSTITGRFLFIQSKRLRWDLKGSYRDVKLLVLHQWNELNNEQKKEWEDMADYIASIGIGKQFYKIQDELEVL